MNYRLFGISNPLLSFQQLTDCSNNVTLSSGTSRGCNGGNIFVAMEYIKYYGLQSLASYPQSPISFSKGLTQPCASKYGPYKINLWWYFTNTDCNTRIRYISAGYALSVFVAAGTPYWYNYASGILSDCFGYTNIDHAVVMVGAYVDTNNANNNYITYKNSWGINWGERGHIRISTRYSSCQACRYGTFST